MVKLKIASRELFLLLVIIMVGAFLRFYGINWDQNSHLHPDERAIVMAVIPLEFPKTLSRFFSPESTWNPHFFAYGNFPFYLLKISSIALSFFNQYFSSYNGITILGRFFSAAFDSLTILIIFLLGKSLGGKKAGLLGAFFYSVSVLPIQVSHFYAVDTILTFFITLTIYFLISFHKKPTIQRALLIGVFFGVSLATKISASVLISAIGVALAADFFFILREHYKNLSLLLRHLSSFSKHLAFLIFVISITAIFTFLVFEPYAIIDFESFKNQTQLQSRMTKDAFAFPYTLQYVGKIPYFYELKNIFLWGQGPILATLSFVGVIYFTFLALQKIIAGKNYDKKYAYELILAAFFWTYFAIVGGFAIGFMRYMLPVYPLLSVFTAIFIYNVIYSKISGLKSPKFFILYMLFFIFVLIWPLSFINIYKHPNTRMSASNWIYQNIPRGSILAIEHWDDQIPFGQPIPYTFLTLPLYDHDSQSKWMGINETLRKTDYIIIASNRLYVPLQKLTDCEKLKPNPCYKGTAEYYRKLFSGELGFQKVAEFTVFPKIPLLNIKINDEAADENFTVFDHPKVMIFKKNY